MLPVREEDIESRQYQENLALVRERVLAFAARRMSDFAHAEDIAQQCVVALWERYPDKRSLAEMVMISIGVARHKIAQFHRDRDRMPPIADSAVDRWEFNPHTGDRLLDQISAREEIDRLLLGMLKLPARCRHLLRLKLIEQHSYEEIRRATGISGNIYEVTRRCFQSLLRHLGGPL